MCSAQYRQFTVFIICDGPKAQLLMCDVGSIHFVFLESCTRSIMMERPLVEDAPAGCVIYRDAIPLCGLTTGSVPIQHHPFIVCRERQKHRGALSAGPAYQMQATRYSQIPRSTFLPLPGVGVQLTHSNARSSNASAVSCRKVTGRRRRMRPVRARHPEAAGDVRQECTRRCAAALLSSRKPGRH